MERWRYQHCHFGTHIVEQLQDTFAPARFEIAVHQHIEQREFYLSQCLQTALEILRGEHFVKKSFRAKLPIPSKNFP